MHLALRPGLAISIFPDEKSILQSGAHLITKEVFRSLFREGASLGGVGMLRELGSLLYMVNVEKAVK